MEEEYISAILKNQIVHELWNKLLEPNKVWYVFSI